jgi:hypothetical protein
MKSLILEPVVATACLILILTGSPVTSASQHDDSAMNRRGDHVMGFEQQKTTHHFVLTKSGGIIQVTAKDASDIASRDHIRMHLQHISKAFAEGDFADPHEVHEEDPPGVATLKKEKDKISYKFESIDAGGKVIIHTDDSTALEAVHEYLRYQIREHKTGDPVTVQ